MTDAPRCPRCRVSFEPFSLDAGTALDLCPRCKGAWFDRGELARVLGARRDLVDPPDDVAPAPPDAPLCPRCPGVCLVSVPFARAVGAPAVDRCPQCDGVFTPLASLPTLRALVERAPRARAPVALAEAPVAAAPARVDDGSALTLRQCALMVPVSFGAVSLVHCTGVGAFLLQGIRVTLHELGHASAAWACGNVSVPLPIGVTFTVPGRSLTLHAMVLALCAAGAWAGLRHRAWALTAACGAYGLAALVCTWGLREATQDMLRTFGGCAGELVLGALLVVLAHFDMPARLRWARWRWIALSLGACAFVGAALFWREAARDWDLIPWDAALADTGDMTKLRDDHGWTEAKITGRYTALSAWCLAAVLTAQMVALAGAWRRRAVSASSP
jgi:Zn-finger nucleic acid-binding protein